MKALFLFVGLIPKIIFAQSWEFKTIGNSFDGFSKLAIVSVESEEFETVFLGVVNNSNSHNLNWGTGNENSIDKLSVRLQIQNQTIPDEILIAFDNEEKYFIADFYTGNNLIVINNAITPDFKKLLTIIDLISLFKVKKNVHIRIISKDKKTDYSFPLKGSADAINKVFSCSSCVRQGNIFDYFNEYIFFSSLFVKVDGNKNYISRVTNCFEYLKEKYGEFYFLQIKSIETDGDNKSPKMIFKNKVNKIIATIEEKIYERNLYHFSGNFKYGAEHKVIKDTGTITIYYDAFKKYTDIVSKNGISLEKFYSLNKKELTVYYNLILKNKEFLDFMRQDEEIYYYYEPNEYTFDVFCEAWGYK